VRHYYCGKGQPFDLVARGYLAQVKKGLASEIAAWEQEAIKGCKTAASRICKGAISPTYITDRKKDHPNLYFSFFELGNTTFIRAYELDVQPDCKRCVVRYDGEIRYSIDDRFKDPLDTFNLIPWDIELPGGQPYTIYGHWKTKPFSGEVRFP
jgi:hypothetical protein